MFPIAMAAARESNIYPESIAYSLILSCGLAILSPVAYQTNIMVYCPGGNRFMDVPRIGFPLTILLAVPCASISPLAFPFRPKP